MAPIGAKFRGWGINLVRAVAMITPDTTSACLFIDMDLFSALK